MRMSVSVSLEPTLVRIANSLWMGLLKLVQFSNARLRLRCVPDLIKYILQRKVELHFLVLTGGSWNSGW